MRMFLFELLLNKDERQGSVLVLFHCCSVCN